MATPGFSRSSFLFVFFALGNTLQHVSAFVFPLRCPYPIGPLPPGGDTDGFFDTSFSGGGTGRDGNPDCGVACNGRAAKTCADFGYPLTTADVSFDFPDDSTSVCEVGPGLEPCDTAYVRSVQALRGATTTEEVLFDSEEGQVAIPVLKDVARESSVFLKVGNYDGDGEVSLLISPADLYIYGVATADANGALKLMLLEDSSQPFSNLAGLPEEATKVLQRSVSVVTPTTMPTSYALLAGGKAGDRAWMYLSEATVKGAAGHLQEFVDSGGDRNATTMRSLVIMITAFSEAARNRAIMNRIDSAMATHSVLGPALVAFTRHWADLSADLHADALPKTYDGVTFEREETLSQMGLGHSSLNGNKSDLENKVTVALNNDNE